MRVLIDTTYAARAPRSGTGIYTEQLIAALERTAEIEVVRAPNSRRRAPAGGGLRSLRNLADDARHTVWTLPRLARRAGAEAIHHPLPALAPRCPLPQIVTVHDLAFERMPECFDRRFRAYARLVHRAAARSAAVVVCVSETTAADVRELWGVAPERIVVARHGPGQVRAGETERGNPGARYDLPGYFLYVGDGEPRKNLRGLLAAYARYRQESQRPLDLLLAGSAIAQGDGVRIAAHPDRGRLLALMSDAAALLHPARYEGFGLSALEAMALGVPVLAHPAPALREVCGDAALYADATRPQEFARALAALAGDPARRTVLSGAGRARAELFSWQQSAAVHSEAYSLVTTG